MPERIVKLSKQAAATAKNRIKDIRTITQETRIIAINAMIEASRIGAAGKGFAVVAQAVDAVSNSINEITSDLECNLRSELELLASHGRDLATYVRGQRLVDLSVNLIDIVDRNLYERSCDVRWWATEGALVGALESPTPENCAKASERLGVILNSYTVYTDLCLMDLSGKVIAHGRRDRFPGVLQSSLAKESWFEPALECATGADYTVADIEANTHYGQTVSTYATPVRRNGEERGQAIGVLAVFFDWEKQSATVVNNVRLGAAERPYTRCMILNKAFRVIASSNGLKSLSEIYPLQTKNNASGSYEDQYGAVVGFAQTVGYETYPGLGWYGVVVQSIPSQ